MNPCSPLPMLTNKTDAQLMYRHFPASGDRFLVRLSKENYGDVDSVVTSSLRM